MNCLTRCEKPQTTEVSTQTTAEHCYGEDAAEEERPSLLVAAEERRRSSLLGDIACASWPRRQQQQQQQSLPRVKQRTVRRRSAGTSTGEGGPSTRGFAAAPCLAEVQVQTQETRGVNEEDTTPSATASATLSCWRATVLETLCGSVREFREGAAYHERQAREMDSAASWAAWARWRHEQLGPDLSYMLMGCSGAVAENYARGTGCIHRTRQGHQERVAAGLACLGYGQEEDSANPPKEAQKKPVSGENAGLFCAAPRTT
eukprot:TRINITY_DN4932_c1_g1_i1.p1 TRINITY_DN4932_c1_g1~~TRINITY_DN4932_c1_g1_i1.p1  ORF type:complete len:260 (-),score=32.81 TRINITY_DN4932_c1_g1_i1:61-840(-)